MDKFVLERTGVGQRHCQGHGGRVVWRRKGPPSVEGALPHLGPVSEFNVSLDGEFPVSRRIQALRWMGSFTGLSPEWWSLWEEC